MFAKATQISRAVSFLRNIGKLTIPRYVVGKTYDELYVGLRASRSHSLQAGRQSGNTARARTESRVFRDSYFATTRDLVEDLFTYDLLGPGFTIKSFDVEPSGRDYSSGAVLIEAVIIQKIANGRLVQVQLNVSNQEGVPIAAGTSIVLPNAPPMPLFPV